MQTLLHLLYFLPALIVYGVWTWYSVDYMLKDKFDDSEFLVVSWCVFHAMVLIGILAFIFYLFIEGIKYFSN